MSTQYCDVYKVAVVGCGRVGMSIAYALLLQGSVNELVLHGRNIDKVYGEKLDLEHGSSFVSHTQIIATDNYKDLAGSDIVIIAAGASQKPGQTRLDLIVTNKTIIEDVVPQVVAYAPQAVQLLVSNPVDILTYHAYKIAGLPKGQIIGSGTTLDTSRFRFHLSEFLKVNPRSIHAYILGEHGDTSFPTLSSASVGGQPLATMPSFDETKAYKAFEQARTAAYKIIDGKGATFYAIATVVAYIVKSILRDTRNVLPLSVPLHNYYGHYGVALSVPSIVGRNGVEEQLEIKLNWEEKQKLEKSVVTLKEHL